MEVDEGGGGAIDQVSTCYNMSQSSELPSGPDRQNTCRCCCTLFANVVWFDEKLNHCWIHVTQRLAIAGPTTSNKVYLLNATPHHTLINSLILKQLDYLV